MTTLVSLFLAIALVVLFVFAISGAFFAVLFVTGRFGDLSEEEFRRRYKP